MTSETNNPMSHHHVELRLNRTVDRMARNARKCRDFVEALDAAYPEVAKDLRRRSFICKGSVYLGSGCRQCVKCQQELADYADVFEVPYPADEPVEPIQLAFPFPGASE